ncbi:molecular chaperone DnaJ [uncultured Prevotellamassilia sp.]|jgi:DnaJ-class molecular chaperone|uniref:molecular chaperone DnaJ n=1 Tax=uncultured Prevotellamassilia sp. TaxID=1926676 RepID=UPI002051B17D|nr:molecular chaperone DnaJ [uncultured Prevotellamassilia sp.]DAH75252.1 MAG TPA: antitermination protein [Caudoviricetes sp.]
MILEVAKMPKVALCRKCYGTGRLHDKETGKESTCDQCEGTGRVTVSAKMRYDIRPYKEKQK